jgi:hypothetical protein
MNKEELQSKHKQLTGQREQLIADLEQTRGGKERSWSRT